MSCEFKFTKVPFQLLANQGALGLSTIDFCVLCQLFAYKRDNEVAWPSIQAIADNMGASYSSVWNTLDSLKKCGAILTRGVDDRAGNTQKVYDLSPILNAVMLLEQGRSPPPFKPKAKRAPKKLNAEFRPKSEPQASTNVIPFKSVPKGILKDLEQIVKAGDLTALPKVLHWQKDSAIWPEIEKQFEKRWLESDFHRKGSVHGTFSENWLSAPWDTVRNAWIQYGYDLQSIEDLPRRLISLYFEGAVKGDYSYL
jgi:hypothetical protein